MDGTGGKLLGLLLYDDLWKIKLLIHEGECLGVSFALK